MSNNPEDIRIDIDHSRAELGRDGTRSQKKLSPEKPWIGKRIASATKSVTLAKPSWVRQSRTIPAWERCIRHRKNFPISAIKRKKPPKMFRKKSLPAPEETHEQQG